MRECSRPNCLFGRDLRVIRAPFVSDPLDRSSMTPWKRLPEEVVWDLARRSGQSIHVAPASVISPT